MTNRIGWAWAFTLESAAKVRTLGQVELIIAFAVAHVTVPARTSALAYLGADDEIALWINGRAVGSHRGGYDAFTIDVTDARVLAVSQRDGGGQRLATTFPEIDVVLLEEFVQGREFSFDSLVADIVSTLASTDPVLGDVDR